MIDVQAILDLHETTVRWWHQQGDCPDFRVNENGTVPFDARQDVNNPCKGFCNWFASSMSKIIASGIKKTSPAAPTSRTPSWPK